MYRYVNMMHNWLFMVISLIAFYIMRIWMMWCDWMSMHCSVNWDIFSVMLHRNICMVLRNNWVTMNGCVHRFCGVVLWYWSVVSLLNWFLI